MGQFTDVHSTKKYRLGTRKRDVEGNEYIYLKGVASTAAYSWVSFDETYTTALAIANAKGRVAIAQAAVDAATKYGWYMIYGKSYGKALAAFADNGAVYLTATAGSVDDADVANDAIAGAWGRSALDAAGNPTGTALFELSFPMVHDIALD